MRVAILLTFAYITHIITGRLDKTMSRKPKAEQSRTDTQVATVICDSCGSAMPANAWSCPHCGDLNADAEAVAFHYLATEPGDTVGQSFFPTPMHPGPFVTPMRPWKYDDPVDADSGVLPNSPAEPQLTVSAPRAEPPVASVQHETPDLAQARHDEQSQGRGTMEQPWQTASAQRATSPRWQTPVPQTPQPEGQHNEKVRLRPRITQYAEENYDYQSIFDRSTNFSAQWAKLADRTNRTNRPYMQYAPLMELLAYVGLLGIGHIYAGFVKLGIILFVGWWGWYLVAKMMSTLSNGATDGLTWLIGVLVPIFSGLWLSFSMWRKWGQGTGT